MFSRLIAVLFMCSMSSVVFAQVYEIPDSSAVNGVGKVFAITNSDFINVTVECTDDVYGYVQSMDQEISINIAKPVPELLATTLTIKNLVPETSYNLIKNGVQEVIVTDEAGVYVCGVDLAQPQKMIVTRRQ